MTTEPYGRTRWTKEGTTPGEDPREIDREQADPEHAARLRERRQVTHDEQESESEMMGTSSTTYDPTERH